MITYVDTASLLKLVIDEEGSELVAQIWDSAEVLASAAAVVVEARAGLVAAKRATRLTATQHREAKAALGCGPTTPSTSQPPSASMPP